MATITLTLPDARYVTEIQRCASDPRVSATCNVPYPYPADGAQRWLERTQQSTREKKNAVFLVLFEGAFCGITSLNAIDWEKRCAELDYWIAGDYQGIGIGTEAARLTIQRARENLHLKVLFSACLVSNPASGHVLQKTGFREIGRFLNAGRVGPKFKHQEMRRFRRDLATGAEEIADYHVTAYLKSTVPSGSPLERGGAQRRGVSPASLTAQVPFPPTA